MDSSQPDTPLGNGYNAEVSSTLSTIFNFDIPSSYAGETCTLVFAFPSQSQLTTSSYNATGSGSIDFAQLSGPATQTTTASNVPTVMSDLGAQAVSPGNSYTITSGPCAAGQTVTYEMSSIGGYSLEYFQDYNECPIGLWVFAA